MHSFIVHLHESLRAENLIAFWIGAWERSSRQMIFSDVLLHDAFDGSLVVATAAQKEEQTVIITATLKSNKCTLLVGPAM